MFLRRKVCSAGLLLAALTHSTIAEPVAESAAAVLKEQVLGSEQLFLVRAEQESHGGPGGADVVSGEKVKKSRNNLAAT
jgi:hypothetical protein